MSQIQFLQKKYVEKANLEKKQASSIQDRLCNWTWNVHSLSALLGGNSLILQLGNVIKISSCVNSQGHIQHKNGAHSLKWNVDDCLTLQHYLIWGREDIQSSSLRWHLLSWNWNKFFFYLPYIFARTELNRREVLELQDCTRQFPPLENNQKLPTIYIFLQGQN